MCVCVCVSEIQQKILGVCVLIGSINFPTSPPCIFSKILLGSQDDIFNSKVSLGSKFPDVYRSGGVFDVTVGKTGSTYVKDLSVKDQRRRNFLTDRTKIEGRVIVLNQIQFRWIWHTHLDSSVSRT